MARGSYLFFIWMVGVHCMTEGTLQWQPQGLSIVQDLKGPPDAPLGSVSVVEAKDALQEEDESYGNFTDKTKVKLPSLPCTTDTDCLRWSDPQLVCREGQCTCKGPYCWVYHLETSGWTSRYVFNCGTCGSLGSSCNSSITCDYPGACFDDGYCHCSRGENFNDICVVTDNSWVYTIVLGGIGIITLIGFALIIYNLLKNPPWRQQDPWCCGLCNTDARPKRRHSIEKTPAFTIQTMYSVQTEENKMAADGDATREPNSRELHESAASGDGAGSVSSTATQMTVLSARSLASGDSASVSTVVLEASSNLAFEDDAEEWVSGKSDEEGSLKSEERLSINSLSSGCSHERCQLCLPKGLSSRPPTTGPPTPSATPAGTTPRESPSSRRSYASSSNGGNGEEREIESTAL